MRAYHLRWSPAPVFVDDYARRMLPGPWRFVIDDPWLSRLVAERALGAFKPLHVENVLRLRFAEDHLEAAIAAGVRQYVVLGAGFDSFALRRPDLVDSVSIFELDHAATQHAKRRRLARLGGQPANLHLVAVDFETEGLDDVLAGTRFDTTEPAFFSWLGVTYYLAKESIRNTLTHIKACAARGSRLALDYRLPRQQLTTAGRAQAERLDRLVNWLGEPMKSSFTDAELRDLLRQAGAERVDALPPEEQQRRYLGGSAATPTAPDFAFALFVFE